MPRSGDDWGTDRLEICYGEARHVLDAQRETMADIDAKAVSTVRITILVIGIVASAARLGGSSLFHPVLFELGIGTLLVSTVAGIFTYAESDLYLGPNRASVRDLAK